MKDITLKITGRSKVDGVEQDDLEFVSEGQAHMKGDTLYLLYDESALTGGDMLKTIIKIKDETMSLKRRGKGSEVYEMFFEKGLRYKTNYHTPYGNIDLEILTRDVVNEINKETLKGKFQIDYEVAFSGKGNDRTRLCIELC